MTVMAWLWIGLSLLGAIVLAAVVWLAGPLVSIGDAQPFESALVRILIILAIVLAVAGAIAWRIISRRRAAATIAQAMTETVAEDSDAPVLKQKMEDALAVLKRTGKSNARALYDLPWYLIIGPPGAGKTTALVNSGLKFPLAGDNTAMAVQGVGGTRYCDWWFTDEAVLIDTAGRYTTQDFGRQGRSAQLARLPRHAGPESSKATDQRRHCRDQHRRCSQSFGEGGGGARRCDPQAPR